MTVILFTWALAYGMVGYKQPSLHLEGILAVGHGVSRTTSTTALHRSVMTDTSQEVVGTDSPLQKALISACESFPARREGGHREHCTAPMSKPSAWWAYISEK